MTDKHEQRKRMKEILSRIQASDFDNWNTSLSENLKQLLSNDLFIKAGDVVGAFAPIQQEPVWMSGVSDDISLAFPCFEEKMLFKISDFEKLEKQFDFGVEILTPTSKSTKIVPKVLLIPGLAFSHTGERLGRGKGFYDRYLESFNGTKIGLCFECQLQEKLPAEAHDQKMNFIVTEKKIYRI